MKKIKEKLETVLLINKFFANKKEQTKMLNISGTGFLHVVVKFFSVKNEYFCF